MKKVICLLLIMVSLVCGCGKMEEEDILKNFKDHIKDAKSYKVTGNMEISNDEETFTYSLESYYLKDDYYKVILVNQTNNHEQIILKNNDDIYVITPALNKSFKFQSEWPGNSSQAYLLGSLVTDLNNDPDAEVIDDDGGYVIKSLVNYPNNDDLKYQKIYLNDKMMPEKVEVFNESDIVKIKVTFDDVNLNAKLNKKEFNLEDYIKEDTNKDKEESKNTNTNTNVNTNNNENTNTNSTNNTENNNSTTDNTSTPERPETENTCEARGTCKEGETTNTENTGNIEDIIYPLYIPSNTYLTSSESIETSVGNRVILTFSGDKNFVLIEEPTIKEDAMSIIPVYGEPLLLSESVGALSANSLSWDASNISYYLASTELSVKEMQLIANSLGNASLVANLK